ncbi:MAG: hypothetical protein ACI4XL_12600 [Bacillus sp. (in: firmicutes)]
MHNGGILPSLLSTLFVPFTKQVGPNPYDTGNSQSHLLRNPLMLFGEKPNEKRSKDDCWKKNNKPDLNDRIPKAHIKPIHRTPPLIF